MNGQRFLRRHLRPAAEKLGIDPKKATCRSPSPVLGNLDGPAGADLKSIQFEMSHTRSQRLTSTSRSYQKHSGEQSRERWNIERTSKSSAQLNWSVWERKMRIPCR